MTRRERKLSPSKFEPANKPYQNSSKDRATAPDLLLISCCLHSLKGRFSAAFKGLATLACGREGGERRQLSQLVCMLVVSASRAARRI